MTAINGHPVILELAAERLFGESKYTGTLRRKSGELVLCSPTSYATPTEAINRAVTHAVSRATIGGYSFYAVQTKEINDDD